MKPSLIGAFAILACLLFAWATGAGRPYPASAGGVIDPTCNSSLGCIEYDNNGAGPGVKSKSLKGNGLAGFTLWNSTSTSPKNGVYGQDESTSGSFNSGVEGKSVRGTGVSGVSTSGFGVVGTSNTIGVRGLTNDPNGIGVQGVSPHIGVYGHSDGGAGVFAEGNGTGAGLDAVSSAGVGVLGGGTIGGQFSSEGVGIISYVDGGATNYPLILRDFFSNDLFFVNGNGDVYYHGGLHSFTVTRNGNIATAYTSKVASPMVEDTGSGQLINGVAMISLDPAFAQTIDPRAPYHVMVTPDGDTRGLYVERKTLAGFIVREVQGGRGSLEFDYHIYAPARGHAGERMVVMTRAAAAALMPKVPVVGRPIRHPGFVAPVH